MVIATAADIPGDNVVSLIKDDQPLLVPVGGEIQHHAEPVALLAAPDRETLRQLKGRIKLVTEPLEPVFDPEASSHVFAQYDGRAGDLDAGFAGADLIIEGEYRVGHQEQLYIENQAMIAVPRRGRRHRHPRLDAVPVLRPQGDEAGAAADLGRRPA